MNNYKKPQELNIIFKEPIIKSTILGGFPVVDRVEVADINTSKLVLLELADRDLKNIDYYRKHLAISSFAFYYLFAKNNFIKSKGGKYYHFSKLNKFRRMFSYEKFTEYLLKIENVYCLHSLIGDKILDLHDVYRVSHYNFKKIPVKDIVMLKHVCYYYIARSSQSHPYMLEEISDNKTWQIRELVANNKNTPKHVLQKLSNDPHISVRRYANKTLGYYV